MEHASSGSLSPWVYDYNTGRKDFVGGLGRQMMGLGENTPNTERSSPSECVYCRRRHYPYRPLRGCTPACLELVQQDSRYYTLGPARPVAAQALQNYRFASTFMPATQNYMCISLQTNPSPPLPNLAFQSGSPTRTGHYRGGGRSSRNNSHQQISQRPAPPECNLRDHPSQPFQGIPAQYGLPPSPTVIINTPTPTDRLQLL